MPTISEEQIDAIEEAANEIDSICGRHGEEITQIVGVLHEIDPRK